MTDLAGEDAKALQRDVQRLLGRCLLRLQQYERLLKAIVSDGEGSGSISDIEALRDRRVVVTGRKTLGLLIGDLLGAQVVSLDSHPPLEAPDMPDKAASFAFRLQLGLAPDDFRQTETDLQELVHLRNGLVHHFIDQHDLWTVEGCRHAQDALVAAFDRIDHHHGQLAGLAESLQTARQGFADLLRSDAIRDAVVNGTDIDMAFE